MSGFFWNIRGFNKLSKQKVVRDWLRTMSSLEFGCLLETKVKAHKMSAVVKNVFGSWNAVSNYEFSRMGRIWVIWSRNVKLQVVFKSSQMITCLIQLHTMDEDFVCSFIYASNLVEERKSLWKDILLQQDSSAYRGKPWLVTGDFNEILDYQEHSEAGNSPQITPGMSDFQDVTRYCSFADLRAHGPLFTWCNKRDTGLICKKLDRTLHNINWLWSFPQSYCLMESGGCSDHLRGIIHLSSGLTPKKVLLSSQMQLHRNQI